MLEPQFLSLSLSNCVKHDLVQLCGDSAARPDKLWSVQIITALTPFSVTQQSLAAEHRVLTGSLRQFSFTLSLHTHMHNTLTHMHKPKFIQTLILFKITTVTHKIHLTQ